MKRQKIARIRELQSNERVSANEQLFTAAIGPAGADYGDEIDIAAAPACTRDEIIEWANEYLKRDYVKGTVVQHLGEYAGIFIR